MTSSKEYFDETVISTGRRGKVRFLFSVDEWLHKGQSGPSSPPGQRL